MEIHSSLVIFSTRKEIVVGDDLTSCSEGALPDHAELFVVGTTERPWRKIDGRSDLDWRLDEILIRLIFSSIAGLTHFVVAREEFLPIVFASEGCDLCRESLSPAED